MDENRAYMRDYWYLHIVTISLTFLTLFLGLGLGIYFLFTSFSNGIINFTKLIGGGVLFILFMTALSYEIIKMIKSNLFTKKFMIFHLIFLSIFLAINLAFYLNNFLNLTEEEYVNTNFQQFSLLTSVIAGFFGYLYIERGTRERTGKSYYSLLREDEEYRKTEMKTGVLTLLILPLGILFFLLLIKIGELFEAFGFELIVGRQMAFILLLPFVIIFLYLYFKNVFRLIINVKKRNSELKNIYG